MKPRILIIDNNIDIYPQLKTAFELENFTVNHIEDGSDAVKRIFQMIPDVILLDLQLVDIDGLDLLRIISRHQNTRHIPIIVISEEANVEDRIVALELGVDDYIEKPFNVREVVLRCRAVHRRNKAYLSKVSEEKIVVNQLEIDSSERRVFCAGNNVDLTKTEFNLLLCLAQLPNRVFAREELLQQIPSKRAKLSDRRVDTHMNRLRNKLGSEGKHIQTVHGIGYRYVN